MVDKKHCANALRSDDKELANLLRHDLLSRTPFALQSHPQFGLFLVASRPISAGEILYEDRAAISGPCANIGDIDYENPLCLGCCLFMEDPELRDNRCTLCNWPICSSSCPGLQNHTLNECPLFTRYKTPFPPCPSITSCYALIQLLRGLLLKHTNPPLWSLIMTLQWKSQYDKIALDIATSRSILRLPSDLFSDDEWRRIYGIVSVNNHTTTLPVSHGSTSIRCGEALFPLYALVANSCSPNCVWALKYDDVRHAFTLAMYPTVDIPRGEMITAAYISSLTKQGNHKRRKRLRERMKFQCKCLRCEDPTELGSYFDALKCFQCKPGFMLPIMGDTDSEEDSGWVCESCHYSVPLLFGVSLLDLVFEQLLETGRRSGEGGGGKILIYVEQFIEKYSGTYLHPNHCILAEAAYVIVQIQLGKIQDGEELTVPELTRYLELCEYLLQIGDKLAPGLSVERGMAHYFIARGLFRKLDLQLNFTHPDDYNNVDEIFKSELLKLVEVQRQAIRLWVENPQRYIFNKEQVERVDRLKQEIEITTEFKKAKQW